MRRHAIYAVMMALTLGTWLLACAATPTPAPTPEPTAPPTPTIDPTPAVTWENPVYPGDFPDPFVLKVGEAYYAYATNALGRSVQVLRSADLFTWEAAGERGDALPELPGWAAALAGLTWAPSVLAQGGGYLLYYVARYKPAGRQCISYALAERPEGPFEDPNAEPFLCQLSGGGSIDPEPFRDRDGALYLLWKNDGNCCGLPVWIWAQRLAPDGRSLEGEPARLIEHDQEWERPLIENPTMTLAEGRYYLLYSANSYEGRDYAVGYAVCDSPLGPCAKPQQGPILASAGSQVGPGGASFFTDAQGQLWMAYHAWTEPLVGYAGGKRSLHLGRVTFEHGAPVIYRPEARQVAP